MVRILALSLPAFAQETTPPTASDIYKSVVRVEVAVQTPDYSTPWNAGRFGGGIGTGFLVGKNKFLTNAHVVSNAKRIIINIHGSAKKYPARVDFIAHDCDLALLSVENFQDFSALPVFSFGDVPKLESQVRVIGYPVGGERISVTRGVVSRIDYQTYTHSRADSHLAVQIDAAINPGNSGGPVLQDGKVVGVAFQTLRQADNTGYMIPTPVIRRFLKDISDGRYKGYCDLGITKFPLFNPAMRRALSLPDNDTGVLVANVILGGPCAGFLKDGDVLDAIDGHPVDSAGMVVLDGESMNMDEIVERKFDGDNVVFHARHNGQWKDVTVPLKRMPWISMYSFQYDKFPRYIVFAGFVFQPLDTNLYASTKLEDIQVRRLYAEYVSKGIFRKRPDVVILTRVESDPITSRLEGFAGLAVDKINGTEVRDLKHANELLHPAKPPEFHVIEFVGADRPLVIPSAEVEAANQRVRKNYHIPHLANLEDNGPSNPPMP